GGALVAYRGQRSGRCLVPDPGCGRSASGAQCPGGCVHPRQLEGISVAGQPAGGSGYPVLPPSAGDRGRYRSGSGGQESGGQPGPGTDAAAPVAADQLAGSGGQGAGTGGTGTAGPGLGRPGKVSSSIRWSGSGSLDELVLVLPGGARHYTQLHIEQRSHSHDQYQPATDHPAQPGRSVAQ